jgi:hypothetical protein
LAKWIRPEPVIPRNATEGSYVLDPDEVTMKELVNDMLKSMAGLPEASFRRLLPFFRQSLLALDSPHPLPACLEEAEVSCPRRIGMK